jgi:hypothetical protein
MRRPDSRIGGGYGGRFTDTAFDGVAQHIITETVMTRKDALSAVHAILLASIAFTALAHVRAVANAQSVATTNESCTVRFATFNASLNRSFAGQLVTDLSTPDNVLGGSSSACL